ncbi:hypothetical protein BBD46_21340 [Natrialba sp. SSL1]|nr:hypothetical protein BBD46_21340 [Natrialba sp. SSL1]
MDAFDTSYRSHQVDLVHVGQTIRDNLWEGGEFPIEIRKTIASGGTNDLFYLKKPVVLHAPKNERLATRLRVDQTLENLTNRCGG